MSIARKCDLCGAYFEERTYPRMCIFPDYDPTRMNSEEKHYDLCGICYHELRLWIRNQRPISGDEQ